MYKIILKNGVTVPEDFADLAAVEAHVKLLGLTGYTIKPI